MICADELFELKTVFKHDFGHSSVIKQQITGPQSLYLHLLNYIMCECIRLIVYRIQGSGSHPIFVLFFIQDVLS